MANLKDIKTRIQSVKNTQKITRAMKMVAAARVKHAENSVKASRPFTEELAKIFKRLLGSTEEHSASVLNIKSAIENYPALLEEREIKTVGVLVMTSNKGLAGAYNANIVRKALKIASDNKNNNINTVFFVIGQKGVSGLKAKANGKFEIAKTYLAAANEPSASASELIAEDVAQAYVSKQIDKIIVLTTKFKNMMSYKVETWDILPLSEEQKTDSETHKIDPTMEFEPSQQAILQRIVPLYITNEIYQGLLEAQASELASRMTAMSAASTNAEKMISTLTVDYNKARQWAITQEILEVVSGADALKG